MEMIDFKCDGCNRPLRVLSKHAGRQVRCPSCKAVTTAPGGAPAPEPMPEPTFAPPPAAAPRPPAPPAQSSAGQEGRRPCPFCAEWILAEAVKCHFCGERTDRAPDAPDRRPFNPFSMFSPLLVISSTVFSAAAFMLTWNVAAALMVGGIVCGLGVALGIAGIVFAIRRRTRGIVGGTTGIVFGVIGICVTIASLVATDYLADALGDFAPELAGVLNPSGAGGDSVLMMCAECGYSEQMAAKDIVKHRLKSAQTMMGGAGDVEGLLDRVEKQGGMGMACPKCGKNQMFASVVCEYCQTAFVPGWRSGKDANYTETICPHCGKKQQDIGPMGFNSKALEGLINKGGGGDIEKLLNETGGGSK